MKKVIYIFWVISIFSFYPLVHAQQNKVSVEWLETNLSKENPRLILTPELEKKVNQLLQSDQFVQDYYALLKAKASATIEKEPLTYEKKGRRLLSVSREAINRMLPLALVARIEKDPIYIERLEEALRAVCEFSDWNPSHFLDVAEMAVAVSFTIDWCGDLIDASLKEKAINTLTENALKPALAKANYNWWTEVHHNWNLVCYGGMTLAALTVFEKEPEIASLILHKAVDKVPLGLEPYAPDGIYPEGPSYWGYATNYLTLMLSAFESSLQTDFGFSNAPGIMESADFTLLTAGPSGDYFNFFDANTNGYLSLSHYGLLNWFENKGGKAVDKQAYQQLVSDQLKELNDNTRFLTLNFLYLCQSERNSKNQATLPNNWVGNGDIPIGVFKPKNESDLYLAAKGGRAADNHGNMDAGSFILEWHKIRFGIDPGNQDYNTLEQIIGSNNLWDESQESIRWNLLTKNNFGHSTLTINNEKHIADARAILIDSKLDVASPSFTFDLTPVFGNNIEKAHRTFTKLSENSIEVTDQLQFSPETSQITWQLMTTAEVKIRKKDILLTQERHQLSIKISGELPFIAEIITLSPPPLEYDKNIEQLKRIDIKFNRTDFKGNEAAIKIILEGVK